MKTTDFAAVKCSQMNDWMLWKQLKQISSVWLSLYTWLHSRISTNTNIVAVAFFPFVISSFLFSRRRLVRSCAHVEFDRDRDCYKFHQITHAFMAKNAFTLFEMTKSVEKLFSNLIAHESKSTDDSLVLSDIFHVCVFSVAFQCGRIFVTIIAYEYLQH